MNYDELNAAGSVRILRVEACGFGCLRSVSQAMRPFQVLIGANASGKTTFLDAIAFLSHLVSRGPAEAVAERTQNFRDLVWRRSGDGFQLAVELAIPAALRSSFDTVRYEVALEIDPSSGELGLQSEAVVLKNTSPQGARRQPDHQPVVRKQPGGNDFFYSETEPDHEVVYSLGPQQSALGNLPEDPTRFPIAVWLKGVLRTGIHQLMLNSLRLRRASPPGKNRRRPEPDGSNLAWMVAELEEHHPQRLAKWVAHLRTALAGLEHIRTVERPDDRHCYLMLRYADGLEVPSWRTSDGTLRLLALTLLAYLPLGRAGASPLVIRGDRGGIKGQECSGIYLIEEPENGIHPLAVETLFQSLSSIYEAQVFVATHSPVVVGLVAPEDLLCFATTAEGASHIVPGSEHPMLEGYRGDPNLGVVFTAGILASATPVEWDSACAK